MEADLILVDTNAWIRHLRIGDSDLVHFLQRQQVHSSDVVIGELLLGSGLPKAFAADLLALPRLPTPGAQETRGFIESHRRLVAGAGIGWADTQIIVTAMKAGARLHTSDGGVKRVSRALGVVLA